MAKKSTTTIDVTTIDREKLEKEIKKEVKEVLLEDLENQVDVLIQSKVDKIERKINKQKQWALFRKNIIIILLLALVLFEGKILYDNGFLNNYKTVSNDSSNQDTNKNVDESIVDEKDEQIDEENTKNEEWYIEEYSYLLDNIKTNLTKDNFTYLYKNDYSAKEIDNKIRLNIAYQLLNEKDISKNDGFLSFNASSLEKTYRTIFGNDLAYKNENFANNCIEYIYNESLSKYLAIDLECEVSTKKIKEQIISIEEKDENIIITTILGIHDTKEKTINNLANTFSDEYKEDISKYEKKLDKFNYKFTKVDDNYYFSSIAKEK